MKETRTFKLNKLVRDKIIELTEGDGGSADYEVLTGRKLNDALLRKLIEETAELKAADLSAEELADMQEILDQLRQNLKISPAEIKDLRTKKNTKNGGFKKGHFIDTVTLPADNKWAKYYASDPERFPEIKTK